MRRSSSKYPVPILDRIVLVTRRYKLAKKTMRLGCVKAHPISAVKSPITVSIGLIGLTADGALIATITPDAKPADSATFDLRYVSSEYYHSTSQFCEWSFSTIRLSREHVAVSDDRRRRRDVWSRWMNHYLLERSCLLRSPILDLDCAIQYWDVIQLIRVPCVDQRRTGKIQQASDLAAR